MLDGKRVLITGAAQGIGRAIAVTAAAQGAGHVIAADINTAGAEETASLVEQAGGQASAVTVDLRSTPSIEAMVASAAQAAGGLDTLINNAGIIEASLGPAATIDELPEEIWDAVLDINLKATWLAIKYAAPHLRASRNGPSIVNAASVTGIAGYPTHPAYCASKGGVIQLTKNAAVDLAPHIRANCYCPGTVDTPMRQRFIDMADDAEAVERFMSASHLIPRPGRPEEVAKLACFLASDDASFINGVAYLVDGGSLAWRGTTS